METPYEIEEIFPDVAAGSARPARRPAGNTAQGLATTLVADYTVRTRAWLPAASLVALLGDCGVSNGAARTAASRLTRRGVLESRRDGRNSYCRLTGAAADELSAGGAWIARFGATVPAWDGRWTLIAFSFPEADNTYRRAFRGRLRWLGFAPLYDGVWISPDTLNPTVREGLAAVTLGTMSVFRSDHVDLATATNRNPIEAWDVAAIARTYETFIRRWRPVLTRVRGGRIAGAAAVKARTEIMDTYRLIPSLDPQLPIELMPADWPRAKAREIFVEIYDGLADRAQEHVRVVVSRFAGRPGAGLRAHTVAEMAAAVADAPRGQLSSTTPA
ncbi:PaaX family transcriptional regulator [Actinoplanes subtropicus]|uniref:PaaX family transcriptional regulator n=1 Tax=Actinoplanes subtropicus TaxID=543632 RepID=UPI0004C3F33E|nr:PaaX family transcriptional regulator C-terminal domain-containing protein [Actinoplanes subtropicus]